MNGTSAASWFETALRASSPWGSARRNTKF